MNCKVEVFDIDLVEETWSLKFIFECESVSLTCTFDVHEPYLHSYEDWFEVARGERDIHLYMGNGEGSIRSSKDGKALKFTAHPSGGGGDVVSTVSVPVELISEKLIDALKEARESGLLFPTRK